MKSYRKKDPLFQWQGAWIGGSYEFLKKAEIQKSTPVPTGSWLVSDDFVRMTYRKDFWIRNSSIATKIEIFIDYDFKFDLYVNGHSTSNGDITALCQPDTVNTIGIRAFLPNQPDQFTMGIRGGIQITYADGRIENILTDESWEGGYTYWGAEESPNWHSTSPNHLSRITVWPIHPRSVKRSLYFRKDFYLNGPVSRSSIFITAKGLYALYVNNQRVGDALLTPGITPIEISMSDPNLSNPIYFQEYDITKLLRSGFNEIGIMTANGWYASESHSNQRTHRNEILVNLVTDYLDGSQSILSTDKSWLMNFSPLIDNDLQMGERFDARLEIPEWNSKLPPENNWEFAEEINSDFENIKPQLFPNIHITESLMPVTITHKDPGVTLYDFGQNNSGRISLLLKNTRPGQKVIVQYAETLNKDNILSVHPYANVFYREDTKPGGISAWAQKNRDVYICSGKPEETHFFEFAYTGFRYVLLTGYDYADENTLTFQVFHTDLRETAQFKCDNSLLNDLWNITRRTFTANCHYGPTDCPTREKNFWNGDLLMFVQTACWMYNCNDFLSAWTTESRKLYGTAPAWIDEDYFTPWMLYLFYGNKQVLEDNYPKMKRLAQKRIAQLKDGLCQSVWGNFGDHCPPSGSSIMEPGYFMQLFYSLSMTTLSKIALQIGEKTDAEYFDKLSKEHAIVFHRHYYDSLNHRYSDHYMNSQVMAIAFGLVPPEELPAVVETLDQIIREKDYRWDCGALSVGYLLPVLTEHGKLETAWKLAIQREFPSFGFMLGHGATTLWESWEDQNFGSQNHYFRGSVCRWFIEYLGGIRWNESTPGFDEVTIHPYIPNDLHQVSIYFDSRHGRISVKWVKTPTQIHFEILIPANISATIELPGLEPYQITNENLLYDYHF